MVRTNTHRGTPASRAAMLRRDVVGGGEATVGGEKGMGDGEEGRVCMAISSITQRQEWPG